MKQQNIKFKMDCTPENIDIASGEIEQFCRNLGTDESDITRIRLSAEECFMCWQDELCKDGKTCKIFLETGKKFLKPFLKIGAEGTGCNPYSDFNEDFGSAGKSMLINIGLAPEYSYEKNSNVVTYKIRKKAKNPLLFLLLIVCSAMFIGLLGKFLIPDGAIDAIVKNLITPVEDTAFNILSCIAGPMIFLSVAWGVYGIGDVYTLGRIGKKLMAGFMGVVFSFAILGTAFYPLLGKGFSNGGVKTSQFDKIFEMILGIFPSNIVSPFVDGNTLQIIFLGFIFGLAMIFLGRRAASVARAIEQLNNIVNFLMEIVSKMVPFFVFIVLIRLFWSDDLKLFSKIWKFALVFILAYVVLILLFTCYSGIRNKINPVKLLLTCLPSYIIALTTASSAATFESNISISTKKLGIKYPMASFTIPFGMVMFKPTTALYYLLICFYFSSVYGVHVSVSWLLIAVVITGICAVATPPIPGGSAATYTILFLQLGIPKEALAIALAVDMIFDFLMTSGDMYSLLMEELNISRRTGMLEEPRIKSNH